MNDRSTGEGSYRLVHWIWWRELVSEREKLVGRSGEKSWCGWLPAAWPPLRRNPFPVRRNTVPGRRRITLETRRDFRVSFRFGAPGTSRRSLTHPVHPCACHLRRHHLDQKKTTSSAGPCGSMCPFLCPTESWGSGGSTRTWTLVRRPEASTRRTHRRRTPSPRRPRRTRRLRKATNRQHRLRDLSTPAQRFIKVKNETHEKAASFISQISHY